MTPEEFRRHGHEVIEWVAGYMERVAELPVTPAVQPGEIAARLPEHAPEEPEPFDDLLRDLDEIVLPGITHWQSPGWFAYFPANVSGPAILGELAAAGLGVQGMLWATSPAATEVELRVVDWLAELLGLPAHFTHAHGPGGGSIQMSASDSTHLAHVVARDRAEGRFPVAYASAQAHSSVARGARVAGYAAVRLVATDDRLALDPEALRDAVERDLTEGLTPTIVTSAIGTTGTGAVDPLEAVADVAEEHGLWHHVDAAWAGSAMILPEQRVHQRGVERVDSYTFNPHKWLFTNFDCNVLWWADRAPLADTLDDTPPYLRDAAGQRGAMVDLRDWQLPLGRRFRALKLWWVLRSYGARGLRHHVAEHIGLARELAARIDAHPALEHVAPPSFALVSFRHVDGNEATDALAAAINASGHSYVTASALADTRFIRVSIGQTYTAREHVDRLWATIEQACVA
jgi:aromatic-L-amino-acid/L-tryptophan decarboxylase